MDSVWQPEALALFLAFFIPGFIMKKVYSLFIPQDPSDWPKLLPEVVTFSALHYVAFSWIILLTWHSPSRWFWIGFVALVLPPIWVPIQLLARDPKTWGPRIFSSKVLSYMLAPDATPWDRVFSDHKERWVLAKMKSGGYLGGFMGKGSSTSTYPDPSQIYITHPWDCDEEGFINEVPKSEGLIIDGAGIECLYLFRVKEKE